MAEGGESTASDKAGFQNPINATEGRGACRARGGGAGLDWSARVFFVVAEVVGLGDNGACF